MDRPGQDRLRGAKLYTVNLSATDTDRQRGSRPVEMDADFEVFETIPQDKLPGFYALRVEPGIKAGKDGKAVPTFKVKGVEYLGPLFPNGDKKP